MYEISILQNFSVIHQISIFEPPKNIEKILWFNFSLQIPRITRLDHIERFLIFLSRIGFMGPIGLPSLLPFFFFFFFN